jgi:hypothetical protein
MKFGLRLIGHLIDDATAEGRPLSAVSCALVGDVAYVVRIETLRSTPLLVDGSRKAKPSLD